MPATKKANKVEAAQQDLSPAFRSKSEFERTLQQMTPAQLAAYKKAKLHDETSQTAGLRDQWEFGKMIRSWSEDVNVYGSAFIDTVAKLLSRTTTYLYKRQNFFLQYDNEELTRLLSLRTHVTGVPLTWSHVQAVASVNDREQRWELLEEACKNGWTNQQLIHAVQASTSLSSDGRRARSGRSVSSPPGVDGKLCQIKETVPMVRKRAACWADEKSGLLAEIRATPAERVKMSWLKDIRDMAQEVRQAEEFLTSCRNQLAEAEQHLSRLLKPANIHRAKKDDLFDE